MTDSLDFTAKLHDVSRQLADSAFKKLLCDPYSDICIWRTRPTATTASQLTAARADRLPDLGSGRTWVQVGKPVSSGHTREQMADRIHSDLYSAEIYSARLSDKQNLDSLTVVR